jgi:uncharacterized membrane-anchored protein YitT (DUF2179 family)
MKHVRALLKLFFQFVLLVFSGGLYAIGVKYFIVPSKVILTGFEGVALSISYYFSDFQLFVILYSAFQAVLLIAAFFVLSKRFAFLTAFIVSMVVLFLEILPEMSFASPESENERVILVFFGGLSIGAAKALAFKNRGSLGDEDIVATYLSQKKMKPVGSIALIAGCLSTVFGMVLIYLKNQDIELIVNTLMYTSIYFFVSAVTLNRLFKKYVLTRVVIITQQPVEVSDLISQMSTQRSHTIQDCIGGYSKQKRHIIKCILPHDELNPFLEHVRETDAHAFVYYHNIQGVEGNFYIHPIA